MKSKLTLSTLALAGLTACSSLPGRETSKTCTGVEALLGGGERLVSLVTDFSGRVREARITDVSSTSGESVEYYGMDLDKDNEMEFYAKSVNPVVDEMGYLFIEAAGPGNPIRLAGEEAEELGLFSSLDALLEGETGDCF